MMPRPVAEPKPSDELREDQYGIVHHCTWEVSRDLRLGPEWGWWARIVCGANRCTEIVQRPVTCIACLTVKEPLSAIEILEEIHARNDT